MKIIDSVVIKLDSSTQATSNNIHFKDSILMIQNEGSNTLTFLNLRGTVKKIYNFNFYKKINKKFKIDAAWFNSSDSIFLYCDKLNCIYLFNQNQILKDSFITNFESDFKQNKKNPTPKISTAQLPIIAEGSIFTTGFSLGEDKTMSDSKKFVVSEFSRNERKFFVNYPKEYVNTNWGGIYFRMVYSCNVEDRLMYISFPASSQIAKFNVVDKRLTYLKLYPEITNVIEPFKVKKNISPKKLNSEIAEHFYGQFSFRGLIYDKYRKLFFRFLLNPTDNISLKKHHMGIQSKKLLVYDAHFNYLGYNELDASFSHFTYFVTEKGLYIQHIKNNKDEDHMYFYLFAVITP